MDIKLTTISQLGSRKSVCELHVRNLLKYSPNGTQHIFYMVDDKNPKLNFYAENYLKNIGEVYYKKDNILIQKPHKNLPPLGGDKNYDWLISKVKTNFFLTLHDDSILFDSKTFDWIHKEIKNGCVFGGFTDGRVHSTYETLLYKGVPFSKLRIGTWFLFGNTFEFNSNHMSMGFYKNVYFFNIKRCLKSNNISTRKFRQWVNGGFPFNVLIRDLGYKISFIEYKTDFRFSKSIIHKEKVTGFFVARGLVNFIDTQEEIKKWKIRLNTITTDKKSFDHNFLKDLYEFLLKNKIKDENLDQILKLFN